MERGIDIHETHTTVDVETLNEVDCMRFEARLGTHVFRQHIDTQFGMDEKVTVLDVGSGFGGPSPLLALMRPNTNLVALELIPEFSKLASMLSERTQVADWM